MITIVRMTRTGSCFVIEEYRKTSYKKLVDKKAMVVPYPKCYSVTEKVSDFFVNGPPTKYFFIRFIFMSG